MKAEAVCAVIYRSDPGGPRYEDVKLVRDTIFLPGPGHAIWPESQPLKRYRRDSQWIGYHILRCLRRKV